MTRPRKPKPAALVAAGPPRPGGGVSPTLATAAGIAQARQLARLGHPVTGIAAGLGVGKETLRQMRKRQPELDEAIEAGLAELEQELVHSLLQQARDGYAPAAMFLLKTKCGYREQGPVDGAEGPRVGIVFNLPGALPAEQYAQLVQVAQLPAPEGDGHD